MEFVDYLGGGWTNPFEKYARQIGSFPQVRGKNKKYLKPPARFYEDIFKISNK